MPSTLSFQRSLALYPPFSVAPGKQPGSTRAESREAAAAAPGAGSTLRVRGCQHARETDVGGVGLRCLSEDGAVSEPLAAGGHQSIWGWGRGRERKAPSGAPGRERQQCQQRRRRRQRRRQWQPGTERVRQASWCSRKEGGAVARTSRP